MAERKHTPGPWSWFGNRSQIYLATPDRGRQYVMGFQRLGLNGAQPTFQMDGVMESATALMRFEVGNQEVCGVEEAKKDPSVYRYDVRAIDHPDAHLIAASPTMFEALEPFGEQARHHIADAPEWDDGSSVSLVVNIRDLRAVLAALSKARGDT